MTKTIDVETLVVQDDGSVFLTFRLPAHDLPVAHVIPASAYVDRAARYGYDPASETFAADVTRRLLHEAHTAEGIRHGQVRSLATADESIDWNLEPHADELARIGVGKSKVKAHRARLLRARVLPPGKPRRKKA